MNSLGLLVAYSRATHTSQAEPTVFVVDDDALVRNSLEPLILSTGREVETFASAEEFLLRERSAAPGCLIIDINLRDLSGLELQQRMTADGNRMPIIFISSCTDVALTVRAMKAGAIEYLIKPLRDEALLAAIEEAIARSRVALARDAEDRVLRDRYALLSPREREVMGLVVTGRLNKQVGGELDISEITVKAHRGKVMRKMNARSLVHLVTMARRLGLGEAA